LPFAKKKPFINETQTSRTCSKRPQSICTSTVVISPDASCPTASNASAMKTPENTEGDPDYPEQAQEGDTQMEYSSD
jgi:hypothetical protein